MGLGVLMSADIDFMIHGVVSYEIFGQTVWITTTHICLLIVTLALIGIAFAINRVMLRATEVPGSIQNVAELVVEKLDGVVKVGMGNSAHKFMNYIGTVFIFILVSNISGLFGLRPPTADYGVTLPLGLITFALIHYNKFKYQNKKKKKENLKRQREANLEMKEYRLSVSIDVHDFDTRVKNSSKYLEKGHRVKASIRFKGREMAHTELGRDVLVRFAEALSNVADVEQKPILEGRNMTMILMPKKEK